MATAQKKKKKTKASAPAASRGLDARRLASAAPPGAVEALSRAIEADGGSVLAAYRDPLGGHWQLLAALPIDRVEPTPYQRDLSETHVGRVANAIDKLDRYLDPVIAVPAGDGKYWSPNGYHRLGAMRRARREVDRRARRSRAGGRAPDSTAQHREGAQSSRAGARGGAARRGARGARRSAGARIRDRVRGGRAGDARLLLPAERPVLRRRVSSDTQALRQVPRLQAARRRSRRDASAPTKLLELNELVNEAVKSMKARGLESPYLKAFVVARINPLRFQRKPTADFDETIDKMLGSARRFDAGEDQGGSGRAHRRRSVDGGVTTVESRRAARGVAVRSHAGRKRFVGCAPRSGRRPTLLVKRDDAIPFGFGGNKVRKLEFVLAEAVARRCRHAGDGRRRAIESRARDGRRGGVARTPVCADPQRRAARAPDRERAARSSARRRDRVHRVAQERANGASERVMASAARRGTPPVLRAARRVDAGRRARASSRRSSELLDQGVATGRDRARGVVGRNAGGAGRRSGAVRPHDARHRA